MKHIGMKQAQAGFTLIELVVVIVILGILAATALPKFIDLTGNADQASVSGIAGGLTSASAINYGGCSVVANVPGTTCTKTTLCSSIGNLMNPAMVIGTTAGATPYLTADTALVVPDGTSTTCTLNIKQGATVYSASYTAITAGQ